MPALPRFNATTPLARGVFFVALAAGLASVYGSQPAARSERPSSEVTRAVAAGLTPRRTYVTQGQPIPTDVELSDPEAEARLDLYEPGQSGALASAPASEGRVDLNAVFPSLREHFRRTHGVRPVKELSDAEASGLPEGAVVKNLGPGVRFVQLFEKGVPRGGPVVIIPMFNPPQAVLMNPQSRVIWSIDPDTRRPPFDPRQGEIRFVPALDAASGGCIVVPAHHVILDTTAGEIEFRLRYDIAPHSCRHFEELVVGGMYTDAPFHRMIPQLPGGAACLVQFGDPSGGGEGGPGRAIDLEPSTMPHDFGVLSFAHGPDPNTNGSQVFICLSREGTKFFDGSYTTFAECVRGAEVILKLAQTKVRGETPIDPPRVLEARLVPAPPHGTGPEAQRRPAPEARTR
jgi:cyclophilin family peptidyl-prolyl cis-trans isomerase